MFILFIKGGRGPKFGKFCLFNTCMVPKPIVQLGLGLS